MPISNQQRVAEIIKYLEQYSDYTDDLHEELGYKLSFLFHNINMHDSLWNIKIRYKSNIHEKIHSFTHFCDM